MSESDLRATHEAATRCLSAIHDFFNAVDIPPIDTGARALEAWKSKAAERSDALQEALGAYELRLADTLTAIETSATRRRGRDLIQYFGRQRLTAHGLVRDLAQDILDRASKAKEANQQVYASAWRGMHYAAWKAVMLGEPLVPLVGDFPARFRELGSRMAQRQANLDRVDEQLARTEASIRQEYAWACEDVPPIVDLIPIARLAQVLPAKKGAKERPRIDSVKRTLERNGAAIVEKNGHDCVECAAAIAAWPDSRKDIQKKIGALSTYLPQKQA